LPYLGAVGHSVCPDSDEGPDPFPSGGHPRLRLMWRVFIGEAVGAAFAPYWVEVLLFVVPVILVVRPPSVVCFLKGKWVSGIVGIFGIIVLVGWLWACGAALRLAKPGSWWARKRYSDEKLARARARYPKDAEAASTGGTS